MSDCGGGLANVVELASKRKAKAGPTPALAVVSPADCAIDISHYQGQIDWAAVPPEIVIVMVKATEGIYFRDPAFAANKAGAEASGRLVIPYHFCTTDDPHEQAKFFISETGLSTGQPYGLDWETYGHVAEITPNVHRTGFDLLERSDRLPLGYWGIYPPGAPDTFMKSWPWWVARYPFPNNGEVPAKVLKGAWRFWQYTDHGSVTGIQGLVDRSLFNGTAEQARAWFLSGK